MSKGWLKGMLAVLCCAYSMCAAADGVEQLKRFVGSTQRAEGEFEQTVLSDNADASLQSGTFAFSRPGKFRWIYKLPYEQWLVGDGERLWIWDIDLNQVTVKKIGDALGATPAAILFGSGDLEGSFVLRNVGSHEGMEWVEAMPKQPDSSFESLRLGLKDGQLQQIEMRDSFGQQSFIVFTRFNVDPTLDEVLFRFEVPIRADVIGDE